MISLIVLFPKIEDAKSIRNLLNRSGFKVEMCCTTGAQALQCAEDLGCGIVICGYKFVDMMYSELNEYLPKDFEMLLMTSRAHLSEAQGSGIVSVEMPLKVNNLIETVNMMTDNLERKRRNRRKVPRGRNEEEQKIISEAKALLMSRNNMTEDEAHKYLQKTSMDSGTGMTETAQMVLALMN